MRTYLNAQPSAGPWGTVNINVPVTNAARTRYVTTANTVPRSPFVVPMPVNGWGLPRVSRVYQARPGVAVLRANQDGDDVEAAEETRLCPTRGGHLPEENAGDDPHGYYHLSCDPTDPEFIERWDGGGLGFSFERYETMGPVGFKYGIRVCEAEEFTWATQVGHIEELDVILLVNGQRARDMSTDEIASQITNGPFTMVLRRHWNDEHEESDDEFGDHPHGAEDHFEKHFDKLTTLHHDYLPEEDHLHSAAWHLTPNVLKMFPIAFLLFTLSIFITPTFLVLYVGEDRNATQFFPNYSRWVLLIPIMSFVTYVAHTFKGGPSKFWVTFNLIGACVVLLITSYSLLSESYAKSPMLSATSDCATWGEKRHLQEEWAMATMFYAQCMNTTATQNNHLSAWPGYKKGLGEDWHLKWQINQNRKFAEAVGDMRIMDCPGYEQKLANHPDWEYLEYLEVYQQCSGWCTLAPPLWRDGKTLDPCSPVVGMIMHDKIGWALRQVVFYTTFTLMAVSAILIGIAPVFRRFGLDW